MSQVNIYVCSNTETILSHFDVPDYANDIDREEAIALGLLGENETIQPSVAQFNDTLEASVKNLDRRFNGS